MYWKTFDLNEKLTASPEYEAYFNQLSGDAKKLIRDEFDTKKVLNPKKILAVMIGEQET